ncbi:MAG TPA: DUF1572 family protein [Saprospiraceae bacterium]|nr:DUF1572 family protein [Saprospiraceae bacterium]HUN16058.1 DUF1572 family protein [Saprospiraceae bacterium]
MLASIFQQIYKRDLKKLVHEIESYNDENNLWKVQHQISNSAGNLCLHIIGNLNTYIGLTLGNIPYERKRNLEFSQKDIAREILVKKIYETIQLVETGLSNLPDEKFSEEYPIKIWEDHASIHTTLLNLATHLNYHLGQINYHRRMIDV